MSEKTNQQNRTLAQANSQMQSELTLSKEKLKVFQHELGCTMALFRSKKSELDEKNKLNGELIEKITIQSERSKLVEIATEERQVGNCMACRLDGDSLLDEESLNNRLCEETNAKATEDYNRAEVTTVISLLRPVSHSRDCIPIRKTTRRSKALGSTTLIDIAKEKLNNQSCETIRSEVEHSKRAEAATNASRSQPVDNNMVCETNRKRITRSESLGAAATLTHQVEVQEKDPRKRSSRRICNIQTTEASKSKDSMPEVVDDEIPAYLAISEPPSKVEAKDDTRTRMSLRSKPNTLKSEACESKDNLFRIMDAEIPVCSVTSEPPNQVEANDKDDTRTQNSFRNGPNTVNSEPCVSEDHLIAIVDAEVEAKQQDDTRTRKSLRSRSSTLKSVARESQGHLLEVEVEAKQEDDERRRKSSRRSSNTLKSGPGESKDHLPASADMNKPTLPTITEPPNAETKDNSTKSEEGNDQKDQIAVTASEGQGQEVKRTSVGRPLRQAAGKISSYKEIALNVKMRRPASLPH